MTGPIATWRAALAEGRFLLQRATGSGEVFLPPRLAEPATGETDWTWDDAIGLGTVYAVTMVHPRPPATPYNVVLVDLDEGPRMMSRIEGVAIDAVRIGMRVAARIDRAGEAPLIVFDPA